MPAHVTKRWIQPPDLPQCLVVEDEPDTNLLVVNETEQYGGLATFPDEETARRVAALWNACSGMETDALRTGELDRALGFLENLARADLNENGVRGMGARAFAALRALGRLP